MFQARYWAQRRGQRRSTISTPNLPPGSSHQTIYQTEQTGPSCESRSYAVLNKTTTFDCRGNFLHCSYGNEHRREGSRGRLSYCPPRSDKSSSPAKQAEKLEKRGRCDRPLPEHQLATAIQPPANRNRIDRKLVDIQANVGERQGHLVRYKRWAKKSSTSNAGRQTLCLLREKKLLGDQRRCPEPAHCRN